MFNFFTKIDDHFIPAFPGYFYSIIFKINILNIQTDTLRYTDSGSEKKSKNRKIPIFVFS